MRVLLLLLAPVLYAQTSGTPGFVGVQAGALSCGAVMRAANQIQTYCYAPGGPPFVTVHNTLNTVNDQIVYGFQWCTPPATGCTYTYIQWDFQIVPTGVNWQYTITGNTIVSGTFTQIYGSTAALPQRVPWSGVALNSDGDHMPVTLWTRTLCPNKVCGTPQTCATIYHKGGTEQQVCPLVNVFNVR